MDDELKPQDVELNAHPTPAPAALADLIERLEAGVLSCGFHEDNSTEMYAVDAATETMWEAAQALRALPAPQVKALERCATEGCGNEAVINFIRGNVGSHYCGACYHKIHALEQDRLSALSGDAKR